jgi:O-antigen/teichoic acid export membrane protein
MLDKLKSIGKQTIVYGFGSVLNKVLGFILIPIYQSHIPIADFGNLVYYETIIFFLSALLSYGITSGHQRFFYIEKKNGTYGTFLFNNFLGCLVLSFISIFPMLLFSNWIALAIDNSVSQASILRISLLIVITEILYIIPLQILQYEAKPIPYLLYNALKLFVTFLVTYYFVVIANSGFEGILFGRLIGGLLIVIITVFFIVYPRVNLKFNLESLKKTIKFGFPHVVSTLGYTLFMITDRFMLKWLSTPDELGKYGFGFRIANFVNLIFVQTIGMSYFPSVMHNENKLDNMRYYRKMLTYYCFLMGFLILGFLFYYKEILWVVGKNPKYWEGLKVVPILSLSFMVMGMNYFVQIGLFLKNKTKYYLIPSFFAIIINVIINYILIPVYGILGAAISVLVAQIIYTSILTFISGKFMKVDYEWGKIFMVFLLSIALFYIVDLVVVDVLFIRLLFKFLVIMAFPIILFILGFFEKIEILNIKLYVKKYLPFQ